MKILAFIIGFMFFSLVLVSVTFTFWQEIIVAGMCGVAMGWGLSGD